MHHVTHTPDTHAAIIRNSRPTTTVRNIYDRPSPLTTAIPPLIFATAERSNTDECVASARLFGRGDPLDHRSDHTAAMRWDGGRGHRRHGVLATMIRAYV